MRTDEQTSPEPFAALRAMSGARRLRLAEQIGAACHEGYRSCFFRSVENGNFKITEPRLQNPEEIYGKKK